MIEGYVEDSWGFATVRRSRWATLVAGKLKKLFIPEKKQDITGYACTSCGYIEQYIKVFSEKK